MWMVSKKSGWEAGHEAVKREGKCSGLTVTRVCRQLRMSRQNYYARRRRRRRREVDAVLIVDLVRLERQLQPRLGGRKLRFLLAGQLARAGVKVGRDRFFEVL